MKEQKKEKRGLFQAIMSIIRIIFRLRRETDDEQKPDKKRG